MLLTKLQIIIQINQEAPKSILIEAQKTREAVREAEMPLDKMSSTQPSVSSSEVRCPDDNSVLKDVSAREEAPSPSSGKGKKVRFLVGDSHDGGLRVVADTRDRFGTERVSEC